MKINEQWVLFKEESHAHIQSEKGIKTVIRSIQTEGHFEISKKMITFEDSTAEQQRRFIKNSCCMRLEEISINIVLFMKRSKI